jgi:hypothetical protein
MRQKPSPYPPKAESILAVLLLAVMYLWVFPYHTPVNNPNENVRIYMTVAIVDDGTFATNRVENAWGYVNDKSLRETPLSEAISQRHLSDDVLRVAGATDDVLLRFRMGRPTREDLALKVPLLYSSKAPGTSYLGVPAYWLLTRWTHQNSRLPAVAPPAPSPPPEVAPAPTVGKQRIPRLRIGNTPPKPIDRTLVVYIVRLFGCVFPGLVFAWFWHRFLGARTRSRTLRDAVFFSSMAGSSLFAYSEVYASHAHNAYCFAVALMAMTTVRERDENYASEGRTPEVHFGMMFLAGMFGAGAVLFEYPAGIATGLIALWIVFSNATRRRVLLGVCAVALCAGAYAFKKRHNVKVAIAAGVVAVICYALTLRKHNIARLAAAGLGGAVPLGLLMLYHKRCFGSAFKPGYSFLENPQFRTEISQGFFGATSFSWDAGMRLWFDPSFGLIPSTFIFAMAFVGLGAMLSWRSPGMIFPPRSPINVSWNQLYRVVFGMLLVVALSGLVTTLKLHSNALSHVDVGRGCVTACLVLIGFLSTVLPVPLRRDRAMGWVILLSFLGLTFLIGMMNNWRGGWQVGPRYLVTLIPALAIAALAGLESIHSTFEHSPIGQRMVTTFAVGATITAFLVTGLPSITFPHLPTEYTSPFFEMVVPVLRDGFVPHNAGHLLDIAGRKSMTVFFLVAALAAATLLRGDERRPWRALAHALASLAVTMLLLVPFAASARTEAAPVTRYVKQAWEPRPITAPPLNPRETLDVSILRAQRHTEAGETAPAMEAWLRVIRARGPVTAQPPTTPPPSP